MSKTSVVILNWNGEKMLREFLPSVLINTPQELAEVVVADNGSTDSSLEVLAIEFPLVKVIKLPGNYGFAGGYNKALKEIESDIYIILNSDVKVSEGWLQPLVDMLQKEDNIAAAMPKIKSYRQPDSFEYAGAAGGCIDYLGYPFCRGRILDSLEKDHGQYNDEKEIFWATGACLAIKSEDFHSVGGFDEGFFAHMEEIDLCWRLKNNGKKIMYTPHSEVFHLGGGSLPNDSPRKLFLNFRNNLLLLYKNLPKRRLLPTILTRMILDGVAALQFLLKLKPNHFWSVLSAHFSFWSLLSKYRRIKKENGPVPNSLPTQVYNKSLILAYYLQGKNKYRELF